MFVFVGENVYILFKVFWHIKESYYDFQYIIWKYIICKDYAVFVLVYVEYICA